MAGGNTQSGRKSSARRRKRRRARDEYVHYYVRVTGWDYYFSFRVSDPKSHWDVGPYSELATLTFAGDVIPPGDTKYKRAFVTLSARTGMMQESGGQPPVSIGHLSAGGEELSGYIFVPVERMAELVAVAQSGRVRIVGMTGTRLRWRSGSIRAVTLNTSEEELQE